jgi:hypothetical protein
MVAAVNATDQSEGLIIAHFDPTRVRGSLHVGLVLLTVPWPFTRLSFVTPSGPRQ